MRGIAAFVGAMSVASSVFAAPVLWDSAEMDALMHLSGTSGRGVEVQGLKPLSTSEALEALDRIPAETPDQALILDQLRQRWSESTAQFGSFRFSLSSFFGYDYLHSEPVQLLQVGAVENPLLMMNEGMFTGGGNLVHLGVRFTGDWTEYFSFAVTPILRFSSRNDLFSDYASYYFREAMGSLHFNRLVLEAGRGSTLWGNGRITHMLFSGESAPLNMVRLRTEGTVIPPGFLDFLGPTKFEMFMAVLDENREFPHARLLGTYFSFLPHPRFEFGLGQTVLFGGEGAPTNNPLVYFDEGVATAKNGTDRNFLISFRWRIPAVEIEPYGEIMIEDCCKLPFLIRPRDAMYLGGLYFPRIDAKGKMDLALEWVRTNEIAYRHSPFTSGYVYGNRMLGHPLGPDAMGIYAALRYFYSERVSGKAIFAYEVRGRLGLALSEADITTIDPAFQRAEERQRIELELNWEPKARWQLRPRAGIERVSNENYLINNGHWNGLIGMEVGHQF